MTIFLKNLDDINQETQHEHEAWIKKNEPFSLDFSEITVERFSILNYPELWSGYRFFETNVVKIGNQTPASNEIFNQINHAKKKFSHEVQKINELNEFEKKYNKYLATLKDRCLLKTIAQSLSEINDPKNPIQIQLLEQIKREFQQFFTRSSLLKMQTRNDCLKVHKQITQLIYELKNIVVQKQYEEITQLEVVSKRFLDHQYEGAKKATFRETITNDFATATSFIGLALGISAAIFSIIGFFFPPILPAAALLGYLGLISYASSVLSAIKMAHEAISYGRGPGSSDIKWMVFDIILAPFYVIGGPLCSRLGHAFKEFKLIQSAMNALGSLWDNVVSNVFPDIFFIQEISSNALMVGSGHTDYGQLKNTLSATSWKKIRSTLSQEDRDILEKITQAKKEFDVLTQSTTNPGSTALKGRDFAYMKLNLSGDKPFTMAQSYHAHILLWDSGFVGTRTSSNAQKIIDAVEAYKRLSPNANASSRVESLLTIKEKCDSYLSQYTTNPSKGRYRFVSNLSTIIEKELDYLCTFAAANEELSKEPPVLVGFKTRQSII